MERFADAHAAAIGEVAAPAALPCDRWRLPGAAEEKERLRPAPAGQAGWERRVPLPAGEPWFVAEHQSGVVLDGHVLVTAPHRTTTVVSAYGLDDAQFEQLRGEHCFDAHRSVPVLRSTTMTSDAHAHVTITPKILYFGTPVVLLSTENDDATINLAPMSSAWALGQVVVLGLGTEGQSAQNLSRRPEMVINIPSPGQWQAVERLAPLTGRSPVPVHKRDRFRYEPAKFDAAGLRPQPSHHVRPPRVADCPLQLEARAVRIRTDAGGGFRIIEAQVLAVHAHSRIVVPGTQHVDPGAWSPLIYNFRHYFGLGQELGHSFRSETAPPRDSAHASPARHPGD